MKLNRAWSMPNSNTFRIKPINSLIRSYIPCGDFTGVDPFVRNSTFRDNFITNDLDMDIVADYHMDALDFLKSLETSSVDIGLFDPPYSPRQVSECYKRLSKTVNMQTTQSSFWGNMKKEFGRIVKTGGIVISFGWNSGGIGKTNGFEIEEVLLVAHGGWHNDTITTVERKIQ